MILYTFKFRQALHNTIGTSPKIDVISWFLTVEKKCLPIIWKVKTMVVHQKKKKTMAIPLALQTRTPIQLYQKQRNRKPFPILSCAQLASNNKSFSNDGFENVSFTRLTHDLVVINEWSQKTKIERSRCVP